MKLVEFFPPDTPCSYLEGYKSSFRYFYIEECNRSFYQGLLERGYRRFGLHFFVPICKECNACKTIRQDVAKFSPTKSHKRVLQKNIHIRVEIKKPTFTQEKLLLYDKYHKNMQIKKGWNYQGVSTDYYNETFILGSLDFGYEFNYYFEDRLIGVGFTDILKDSISAIYFFYDHDFQKQSLGIFNILMQLYFAKQKQIKYFYPGYWIPNHHSLGYKSQFMPFEILYNTPDLFEALDYRILKECE